MFFETMTMPLRVMARMTDLVTGGSKVDVDDHHEVVGDSASAWADHFERNPSRISPLTVGAHKVGDSHRGRPFPMGPEIGITVTGRKDDDTPTGRHRTVLDVRYEGDFAGRGRITVTEKSGHKLDVRDQWLEVDNRSMLPSRAAEVGHPIVAGLGFQSFGKRD